MLDPDFRYVFLLPSTSILTEGIEVGKPLFVIFAVVTVAFVFDATMSLAIPQSVLASAPRMYAEFFVYFKNPLLLVGIYLASLAELLLLSRTAPLLKRALRPLHH